MNDKFSFQSIILNLQSYWANNGCMIWQPYYSQVGAGTYNPATFLRVLGPEPWNVAYVEPSIRPDDGRYGENPNRLQQHYQFQVILKPDPGNPQELYLNSLKAIGIDPEKHDIRFVEDNWESPALGAWGLGWEVWLDGLEITQFTYFQQAGGIVLDPVSVEITYGLERIAMALQGVRNFQNIQWNNKRTYGDVNLQGEQEHSKYYFEIADVDHLRQMYDIFESEANRALENKLILPAYDYNLKCSHTFNILDTRGAVGVTERQALFSRMRDLSRRTAEAYLEQREQLGYPWGSLTKSDNNVDDSTSTTTDTFKTQQASSTNKAEMLIEIGVEEIPVSDLSSVLHQLEEKTPILLKGERLNYSSIGILGTPRRLVINVKDLDTQQEDISDLVKGPPASRAFDEQGNPTKAALGFARSKGIDAADLKVQEIDGGEYAVATVHIKGRSTIEILSSKIPELISSLSFEKSMRWNNTNIMFSRPIRWILAILGDQTIPFEFAGIQSGRITKPLRFHVPDNIEIQNPKEYFDSMENNGIIIDTQRRKEIISEQVKTIFNEIGGSTEIDLPLLDEVTNLVEAPTALLGSFEQSHLELPPEVLTSVMKKHQRYFPVHKPNGDLLPHFVAVRNGNEDHLEIVTDGNEQVVRARFADAAFFVKEDKKQTLEAFIPSLEMLTFQFKLGSMLDKSKRIEKIVQRLTDILETDKSTKEIALRAAYLCKADLVTHMVIEMTSLQGLMGKYYALASGENKDVAKAIFEHYLPRFSGDITPTEKAGFIIGIADRLDSIVGLFSAGLAPTGTKDPFALRRAALGLVQNLISWNLDFDLKPIISITSEYLPIESSPEKINDSLDFIYGRLRSYLADQGFRHDIIEAVMTQQKHNPAGTMRAANQLSAWVSKPEWSTTILPAYSRCVRITRDLEKEFNVSKDLLKEKPENDLYNALLNAENNSGNPESIDDFLNNFLPLIPAINTFFDEVLVMDKNIEIRNNRLALLQRVASLSANAADLSHLEGF